MKIWWDMHLQAFASTHVIIIPDGQERWVITNHEDVASKYGIQLAGGSGEYQTITFDPAVTNPECSGEIDTNPSPEKRDHVKAELGFLCTGDTTSGTAAPAPCPWE